MTSKVDHFSNISRFIDQLTDYQLQRLIFHWTHCDQFHQHAQTFAEMPNRRDGDADDSPDDLPSLEKLDSPTGRKLLLSQSLG